MVNKFFEKKGIKPSAIYDTYWKFAYERQNIFYARINNITPWTNDEVLSTYKFTNAYRASDRVSQYLLKNVIYKSEYNKEDTIFRILLFKLFNKIETWEYLENKLDGIDFKRYSFEKYDKLLLELIEKNKKIYSAAYIMPSGMYFGQGKKHQNNLRLLEMIMADKIVEKIDGCDSLEALYELMITYPSIGPFLGFQYAIDLNYSELCDFSEMDYVIAGPGALSGISKCFDDIGNYSPEDIIRFMAEIQEEEFERLGLCFKYLGKRKLQLIDCQNLFCETDKYTRAVYPEVAGNNKRTKIKQFFKPNLNNSIQFFYPPKWDITL